MNECPHCHRKLLSHASLRCNWCGQEIQDPSFRAQAETEREAFFAEQAAHDAASLARMDSWSINPLATPLDPLTGLPLGGFMPRRHPLPQRPPVIQPQSGGPMGTVDAPAFGTDYRTQNTPAPVESAVETEEGENLAEREEARFNHLEL